MARLTIAQTAAPDFSNAASLLNQSGKALDGAFETASGVLSKYKSGQEEKADGEIIKEIARLNDESEIEKFLASDKVQNSPLSRNMQDKLIGLRGQLLDFAATRANTEGRQSSTNATDSATRLAEAREPLGLRLLGAQVANAEQGNVDQLTRSEYLRDQLQSDLDTAQVGRDNTIVSTQGTQIDNETRGARNNASLGQTLATTGQIKANTELTGLNSDGKRTSNAVDELRLAAEPQLISDQARLRELGIEGTVTNNATAEIARQSGQLNLNAQPTLINQEIAQNSANRAATESSTASNNASRIRLNQEASRQQQRFQQEENTRTKLQALGPAYIEAYQAAKQDGSVANINRLTQLMEIAELTPNESNEIFSTIGSVGTIADARNQDNQNREDKRLTDEATLNALIDPTITTSQDAVRQVARNTNLNATQALAAAQNVATLSSGQLDVVVSPDVGVDEDIASTIRAAESRLVDKRRSDGTTRKFYEAEGFREKLNNNKTNLDILTEMFPTADDNKLYELEQFVNQASSSGEVPPEYIFVEMREELRSYDTSTKIGDFIRNTFSLSPKDRRIERIKDNVQQSFSEQDRIAYEEKEINLDRQRRDLTTEQNKLNRIRSSILKYGSGTVPASLIAEERAQFAKTLELADSIAQ